MQMLQLKSNLLQFEAPEAFLKAYNIGEGDLIITNRFIFEPFFGAAPQGAFVLYQEDYGAGEPSDEMFEAMRRAARPVERFSRVFGIGGGTVMDLSKLFAQQLPEAIIDLFRKTVPAKKVRSLVLLPTTCGTGSEVTNISVMAFPSRGTKLSLLDNALYADDAVFVKGLLAKLPYGVFATSSIDALIHAVESSLNPKSTPVSALFAAKAIDVIVKGYLRVRDEGQQVYAELLDDFSLASAYAGIAFNTAGCAAVHAMSYPLSGTFHVPHGEANYAMFAGVMRRYVACRTDGALGALCETLSALLGCAPQQAIEQLDALLGAVLRKKSLREYGANEEMVAQWAKSVVVDQRRLLGNNFVPFEERDIREIYLSLL